MYPPVQKEGTFYYWMSFFLLSDYLMKVKQTNHLMIANIFVSWLCQAKSSQHLNILLKVTHFLSTLLRSLTPSRWSFLTLGVLASCFLQVRSRQSGQSSGPPPAWWVINNKLIMCVKRQTCSSFSTQTAVFALSDWIVLSSPSRPPVILWDLTLPDRRRYRKIKNLDSTRKNGNIGPRRNWVSCCCWILII